MASPKQRKKRAKAMLLREQERETITEVIPKKVVVVEEPVEVAEVETAEEEVVEEVVEAPKKKVRSIREILND
jgi:hypothetical protein